MIIKSPTTQAGTLVPSGGFPADSQTVEVHYDGTNYRFTTLDDLGSTDSATINSMPRKTINVVNTNFTVPANFFGAHFHRWPYSTSTVTTVREPFTYAIVRSHDGANLRWASIETSKGVFNWTGFDAWVSTHTAAGHEMIFTLFGCPAWASARPAEASAYNVNGLAAEPTNIQDLIDFTNAVVARAAGRIQHWELWNEPNLTGFYTGTVAKLAEMMRVFHTAVKAGMPSANVICPSVTGWVPTAGGTSETYLTNLMNASDGATGTGKDWFDTCGVHLYCTGGSTRNIPGMVDRVRAVLTAVGKSSVPLWDTESGILSPFPTAITPERRKKLVTEQMVLAAAKGVSRVCWYAYDNTDMGFANDPEFHAHWETLVARLAGKQVQAVVQYQASTTYVVDGQRYTV